MLWKRGFLKEFNHLKQSGNEITLNEGFITHNSKMFCKNPKKKKQESKKKKKKKT